MMDSFISIDGAPSPYTVTQNFSLVVSALFDFEFYKIEMIHQFNEYLRENSAAFYDFSRQLYDLQQQLLHSNIGALQFSLFLNYKFLQVLRINNVKIDSYLKLYHKYFHPCIIEFRHEDGTLLLDEIIKKDMILLTELHIANLKNEMEPIEKLVLNFSNVLTQAKKYEKKQQHLYTSILEIEKSFIEVSKKLTLDEDTSEYIALMQHHHSSGNMNDDAIHLTHDEICDSDEYGQFVEIEPDDSLLVYASSKQDLFFDQAVFDLRAANFFVNSSLGSNNQAIVYQFSPADFKTKI